MESEDALLERHKWIVKVASIALATLAWVTVNQRVEDTRELKIPLVFEMAENTIVRMSNGAEMPEYLSVIVSGPRSRVQGIVPSAVRIRKTIESTLGEKTFSFSRDDVPIDGVRIKSIEPSALAITIEKEYVRYLNVKVLTHGSVRKGFYLKSAYAKPIEVRGRNNLRDALFVETQPVVIEDMSKSEQVQVKLSSSTNNNASFKGVNSALVSLNVIAETPIATYPSIPIYVLAPQKFQYSIEIEPSTISMRVKSIESATPFPPTGPRAYIDVRSSHPQADLSSVSRVQIELPYGHSLVGTPPEVKMTFRDLKKTTEDTELKENPIP